MAELDDFLAPFRAFWSLAPQQLSQQFLNGWSLINVTEQNSSRPETERAIVAGESYGRQIGRLTEAVLALIEERPDDAPPVTAFADLAALHARIERIKCEAAGKRLARLREDLDLLKRADRAAYDRELAVLQILLDG